MSESWYRLSLRDLFWLVLLTAIGLAWWREIGEAHANWDRYERIRITKHEPTGNSKFRHELVQEFRDETDKYLRQIFREREPHDVSQEHQCLLLELSRRKMIRELQKRYDALVAEGKENGWQSEQTMVLTAIRRARGEPDPVIVKIEAIHGTGVEISISTPKSEEEKVYVFEGCMDRGGRRLFCHLQLLDLHGKPLPLSNFDLCDAFESEFNDDIVQKWMSKGGGFTMKNLLETRSYVAPPPDGNYQLQLLYGLKRMAGEPDPEGLIYWKSEPVPVIVENFEDQPPYSRIVMPIITIALGVALCITRFSQRALTPTDGNRPPPLFTWRELLTALLSLTLIVGGLLGSQYLLREPVGVLNERHANWTMRKAE